MIDTNDVIETKGTRAKILSVKFKAHFSDKSQCFKFLSIYGIFYMELFKIKTKMTILHVPYCMQSSNQTINKIIMNCVLFLL